MNIDKEQAGTLEALQYAIQMEIDGKKHYQKAGQKSCARAGKELFEWLAGEEDWHRQKFEQIYKTLQQNKAWPEVIIQSGRESIAETLFTRPIKVAECKNAAHRAELKAITKAMEMENKTHDFYKQQSESATYQAQKGFYKALAAEERKHFLALVDYREYLVDTEGWLRKTEHHSLDGG